MKFADEVYKDLLAERKILINDDISEDLIEKAVMMIFSMNEEDDDKEDSEKNFKRESDPIILYINTSGGECYQALSLISAIETSKTPVITVALGKCMSAGFSILMAGHKRVCQKYSTLMYHECASAMSGELKHIKNKAGEMERLQKVLDAMVVEKIKLTKEELKEKYADGDWYVSPKEATKLGIVDGVI